MTKDELRQYAAVLLGKVLLRAYLARNEATPQLADDVAKAAVLTADILVKRLYPGETQDD